MRNTSREWFYEDSSCSISSIDDIIADLRAGRPVIFVDDENRENEGDLIIPAARITPDIINFMIRKCGGFICLTLEQACADRLGLTLQPRRNVSDQQAYFTVSIEARHGVTTGVSAEDRARTILTAIRPDSTEADIATPGHIFPLLAREGGVLVRRGHTEASIDLAKLAGYSGAAVICEIMNEDGSMARLKDLVDFAAHNNLRIGTIEDLVKYRKG